MKTSFVLCTLLVALSPLTASAQRKGMGPSAIEAARLKKYPPPNYLSHYLPDDRYKIAGKVWKYVSTDLDTYYHLPSSPNMLRQPASRVIGFANAKDAEEAGYVADPTDGTANSVAASAPRSNLMPDIKGIRAPRSASTFESLPAAEQAYLLKVFLLQNTYSSRLASSFSQMGNLVNGNPGASNTSIVATTTPIVNQAVSNMDSWLNDFTQLKPPRRIRGFYATYIFALKTLQLGVNQFKQSIQEKSLPMNAIAMQNIRKGKYLIDNSYRSIP